MTQDLIYIQLKKMEDLIRLVVLSPTPFIQHTIIEGKHVYFVQGTLSLGRPVIYFFQGAEEIQKKYVVYNRFKDEVGYSDQPSSDGQTVSIPIIEIEKTNLFEKIFEKEVV
ncbi:hypothetical protein DRO26_04365 [Candidatus Bathyarchaeota archaeon]|nr:MAG: hypothetical protein DRO26_04365 [Candidatus Bathyarchaeota archaeon]